MDTIDRYREAEARLWNETVGSQPGERMVRLPGVGSSVRVLESGEGPSVLFLHGGPNAASTWTPLVARLPGFRCILVDRPGCGLSEPAANKGSGVRPFVVQMVADIRRALDVQISAIVGSSFGSYSTLAHAIEFPDEGLPTVHLGCPAMVPRSTLPIRMLLRALPLTRGIFLRLEPPTAKTARKLFSEIGHGASLEGEVGASVAMEWYAALLAHTQTRENDLALFGRIRPRDGLKAEELGRVESPVSFFWATHDPFGGEAVAKGVDRVMPDSRLELLDGSGHLPWLDVPGRAAEHVRAFLEERVAPR